MRTVHTKEFRSELSDVIQAYSVDRMSTPVPQERYRRKFVKKKTDNAPSRSGGGGVPLAGYNMYSSVGSKLTMPLSFRLET